MSQQPQQQFSQQLHAPPSSRESDNLSINNGIQGGQQIHQQPYQQQQHGSYGNESILNSQTVQYPYQQQQNDMQSQGYTVPNMDNAGNGGYGMDGDQQHQYQQQQQQHMDMSGGNGQDGYYGMNNNNNGNPNPGGYDVNALTSATLNLSGLGGNGGNYQNGMDNNNINNNNMNMNNNGLANGNPMNNGGNSNNDSNNNSGELVLSADVRKLQDEVLSWKKSQESSQAKVNQLRTTLTQKSQENRELHQSLTQVTQDRLRLQELVHKREKEMDELRSKYLNDVRQIRATDDDHSTIENRVRVLQAAILQLTKSSAGDRAANLNVEEVQLLVKKKYKFGNTQPYILNMFLEKYIMDTLLEEVFNGPPFYVGFELCKEYGAIHKWMVENNFHDQAVRFRQQLCFLSARAPVAQAYATQEAQRIAKGFEIKLERLYHNWSGHQKVLDMVTKAIELSLTMRSQNAEIVAQVISNETDFDPERMVPAHKSKEGGKVKVCVMPCFVDTNGVIIGKAKVFCG
ncbi:hypothetical protein BCR41DRAFT_370243 [Lobosporangium transversale]|uniref:Uncharacterized protein n=1 Tax=Lobosporangium transversale TaxID=64571 RepID=A0A1Y2GNZ4_9FUNG|nr:hypothetical protein BCR41DRAFT_370243 [Lobosporangium transversale]ORZ17431.1 hypothetical protein BCR41DRAFT_370243 [Lobosporangium transversale]|eukprot:XP_021881818.1 hypothetical protein BCR41DRAFT_370243 [Lobosporangium transversale]